MTAHYFTKRDGGELIISATPDLRGETRRIPVSGKREARKLAKELNAKPWNF